MIVLLFTVDERSADMSVVKYLPSVGRGMKLPPICDVVFPEAYYDELSSHTNMLCKSGMGRGKQLNTFVGSNDSEPPGKRFMCHATYQHSNVEVPVYCEEEFPKLDSKKMPIEEKAVRQPEVSHNMSLKSLAAQLTSIK